MARIISQKLCKHCGELGSIAVNAEKYKQWMSGMLIQQVFPELTLNQRELLQTGTHSECWDAMFGGND